MHDLNPAVQRHISESLIADRWQTRQIAHTSFPGSKWVLVGPQLRSRLVMSSDIFDASARLSTSEVRRPGQAVQQWQLVARLASAEMILAVARVAETASDSEPVAWSRRRLHRHLRIIGWRRTTGRLRAIFGTETMWESPGGTHRLTVFSPSSRHADAADLSGPDVLVSIGPTTPVTVVASLADAITNGQTRQGEENAR